MKSNPSSQKNLDLRPYDHTTDRTRCYFWHARPNVLRALSEPLGNGRAREKDNIPYKCASGDIGRWQWSAHSRVSNFSVAYRGHKVSHCTRASRGLVDVKPCKQIICNPLFWREIKLVRLKLKSNSQYFAILINSQSNNTGRAKPLSMGGNCYNWNL